jgi:hypothetical protein
MTTSVRSDMVTDALGHPLWLEDSMTRQMKALTEYINQLPVQRVQRLLRTNPRLRWLEIGAGGAILGYQATHGGVTSGLANIGMQTIRLSGAAPMDPLGFRLTPSIQNHGFAVYLRKSM